MVITGQDIGMTRGDTETLTVRMHDKTLDTDIDFEDGDIAVMTVRKSRKEDAAVLFSIEGSSYEGPTVTFDIDPGLTERKKAGDYVYDVEVTFADGTVKTIVGGRQTDAVFHLWQDSTYE